MTEFYFLSLTEKKLYVTFLHIPPDPATTPVPAPGKAPVPKAPPNPGKPDKSSMGF